MTASPSRALTHVKLALVAVIWGGTFIAGRVVSAEMASTAAALWRYLVASVAILGGIAVVVVEKTRAYSDV